MSLDAPLVAVVWEALFARCFTIPLSPALIAALALTVWFVYVSDRLLDVLRTYPYELPARHEFSRRHWKAFATGAVLSLSVLERICQHLPPVIMRNGLCLLGAVVVYFAVVHGEPLCFQRFWPKEFVVGLIFSTGVCLPVWSAAKHLLQNLLLPGFLFAALCTSNCLAIEYWEAQQQQLLGRKQIHPLTLRAAKRLPAITLVLQFASAVAIIDGPPESRALFAALFLGAAALLLLSKQSHRFSAPALRVLADAALLSPVVAWLFAK